MLNIRIVGRAVKEARLKRGLTQRELALKAHVSERTIVSLEQGDSTGIRLDKLLSVLEALNLDLEIASPEPSPPTTAALWREQRARERNCAPAF